MSMEHPPREPAEPAQVRRVGDPLQMTEAEKRAAEWEARHDVAARGRREGAETVQHYVAHERLVHADEPHRPVERAARRVDQPVQPVAARPVSGVRRLLRRVMRRAG